MWTTEYIISQVCVLIAISIFLTSTFLRNRKVVLILNCFVNLFYALEYLFLKSYTGIVINVIGIARGIWFFFDAKIGNKNYISLISCCLSFLIGGILTYNSWIDILAILGSLVFTFAIWQPSLQLYRILVIVNNLLFFVFNFYNKAYISVIFECITIIVTIISIIKFHIENKNKKGKETKILEIK